jgi:diacylglycerol kinase (ATP)
MAKACDLANRRYKWMGSASYSWAILPELARLRAPMTRLTLDGGEREEPLALVAVCNTQHTGGAMRIAPAAVADDGLLDIIALRDVSRARLLRLFPKIFGGSHVDEPDVLVARAKRIRIEPAEPSPLLGDGEVYGATPVDIECLPRVLRLLV